MTSVSDTWPELALEAWQETYATVHMWTQIVGKVRLALTPMVNHWWNVPLYLTSRGLTTTAIPYDHRTFSIDFDFIAHELVVHCSDGATVRAPLAAMTVADFYALVMRMLGEIGVSVKIWPVPVEISDPVPFEEDTVHASYDAAAVERFWRVLGRIERVLSEFRSEFTGKCSPVHFFWGSFDLAVTRFSGRPASPREGADVITRLSYNAELSSIGFWPGAGLGQAAFYSYTYPEPPGFRDAPVLPEGAYYDTALGEFLLPYEVIRTSADPAAAILAFARSTYEAGARLQGWPVDSLEHRPTVGAGASEG